MPLVENFFFSVLGSVSLYGASWYGVGGDLLGADHRLLPV